MKQPDIPANERERLNALCRYNILDTPAEKCFDRLTELAANICDTPIAMITFVDESRDWFKSRTGITRTEAERKISFCAHTILCNDLFIVPDTYKDKNFFDNPLVTDEPAIRFYAGAPLISPDGYAVGTVCVIDLFPRHLTQDQQNALKEIARQVMLQLNVREKKYQLNSKISKKDLGDIKKINDQLCDELFLRLASELEMKTAQNRLARALDSAHTGTWDWDMQTGRIIWNSMHEQIFGFKPGTFRGTYREFEKRIHPDDRDKLRESVAFAIRNKQRHLSEFRIVWPDKSIHWVRGHGQFVFNKQGKPVRMYGIVVDITSEKTAQLKLERTMRSLNVLNACNKALTSVNEEKKLVDTICKIIVEHGGYRFAWIGYPQDDRDKTIKPVAHAGHEAGYLENRISWDKDDVYGRGPAGRATRSGKNVITRNIANSKRFKPWRDAALERGYASLAALVLKANNEGLLGLLMIYAAEADAFDRDEVTLLSELADNLAWGLHSLRNREELNIARKAANRHLRELKMLYETAPVGLALMDKSCRYITVNKKLAEMNGLAAEKILNRTIDDIIPKLAPRIRSMITQVFRTKKPVLGVEMHGWSPVTRSTMYWLSHYYPLVSPDGEIHAVNTIVQDITDIRQAREELSIIYQLVHASSDYHSFVDRNYIYRSINDSYLNAFNKSKGEIVGHSVAELFGEDKFRKDIKPQMDRCLAGEKIQYQLLEDLPGLGKRWSEIHFDPVEKNNEIVGIAVNVRDITKRKEAEYRLQMYRDIISTTSDLMAFVDRNYVFQVVNDALLNAFGKTTDEVIGHKVEELTGSDFFNNNQKPHLDRCLAGSNVTLNEWHELPNLGRRFLKVSFKPYFETDGSTSGIIITKNDITDRKQIEEELKVSRERYRSILDTTGEWIWEIDLQGRHTYSNQALTIMLGYTFDEIKDLNVLDLIHEEDREKAQKVMETSIKHKRGWTDLVSRLKHKNGGYRYMECNAVPVIDNTGNVTGFRGSDRDITERINAETEKNYLLKRNSALVTALAEIVYEWKPKENTLFWDGDYTVILGYSENEIGNATNSWIDRIHPEDKGKALREVENAARESRPYDLEYRFLHRNGNYIWMHDRGVLTLDNKGKVDSILGVLRDTSHFRQAEKKMQESEEKYRALYNDNPNMCFTTDEEGTIFSVNITGAEHLGYTSNELIGKPLTIVFPESEHAMAMKNLRYCIGLDGGMHEWEITKVCKDGRILWVKESARAIKSFDNVTVLIVCIDITKNKEAESEILESRERLRNLAEKLHNIREDERATISREIHDELGQTLTGLRIDLAWLLDKMNSQQPLLSDRTRKALLLADETLETVRRISHDLRPAMLDDLGLAAAIEWQMEEFSKRTGCHYNLVLEAGDIGLNRNRDTIVFRILQEALTNIIRHAKADNIHVSLEKKKHDLVMGITDDGVGISDAALNSNKSIGLIGMRERATSIGGKIDIFRLDNSGTRVVLSIPADSIHE